MTFVNIAGLNVDLSAFSPSNQEFIRLVLPGLENTEQAEAAVSPAPPQPASTAVPTDASGVGKPEVSSPPRPSSISVLGHTPSRHDDKWAYEFVVP